MQKPYRATTQESIRAVRAPLLAVGLAALLTACSSSDGGNPANANPAAMPPPSVTVSPVVIRQVSDTENYVGRTSAVQRVGLVARVPGILEKRAFLEGADVSAGDVVFEIDPRQYEANHAVTAAAVASAEAAYQEALQFRNRLRAVTAGGVSATAKDEAENNFLQAAALLEQAKAQHQLSELDLSYAKIDAPISGRIGTAAVDVGNLVGPDTGVLATIVQLDPVRVTFGVSERASTEFMHARIEKGLGRPSMEFFTPRIILSDGEEYPHVGKLDFVSTEINPATSTLEVRAVFPNPDGLIRPGQFVNVAVQRGDTVERPVVPQSSVQQDQGGYYVLVVDNEGAVEQRRVVLGDRLGIDWVVESGVAVGEQVIYAGLQKVRPDAKVTVTVGDPRSGLEG